MVRETRHLWVGNLPDNIREDRIREHFKRYGRVQSVKLLSRSAKEEAGENTTACTVAFMDIKSASKAHTAEHKIDDKTLTTEYYEPAAIPSTASPQNTNSTYSTSPGSTRFTNSHGTPDEHGNFNDRFYDRNNSRVVADSEYIRRQNYHDGRSRNRDRGYRNGPFNNVSERHRSLNSSWSYDSSRSYNNETGYGTPTDTTDKRSTDSQSTTTNSSKKKAKSPSESRSVSPSGSNTSRSPSRSRSQSSSSSSSSTTSQETSSTSSRKSRRIAASSNSSHQPIVHSDDRRPLAICVKNLPLRSSDTSLKDGLFHEYKKHGKVTWVKIVGQGSDRHAIVCFKKPEDVDKAIEVSYDKLFFGCKIEVAPYQGYDVDDNELRPYEAEIDEFHPKATRTLFIGNLEKDFTASDLRKHFDQFGEIIEIDIKKQGAVTSYAFCQYSDIISVVKAIRAMDGEHLGNNRIKLGFGKSMPTNCVWVDGVVDSVTDKYLTMQFDSFGPISQVIIDRDKGQALIFYEQVANAQVAVTKMRGVTLRGRKVQVDFASRECQESFYEHLEKQGHSADRQPNFDEKRDTVSITTSTRYTRYETPSRPRSTSYNANRTSASTAQCNTPTVLHSPGTPGSVTPRGTGSRSRSRITDYYDQVSVNSVDYVDRRYRSYDEYSQSSAASHEDVFEHDHRESPIRTDHNDHTVVTSFPPPEMRILQKERFHLLEQLDDYISSGDELVNPKKRLRLDLDNSIGSDVIIEANRDHRKVMEVRRTSDGSLKHYSRRPSVDSNKHSYLPHAVCKRRKTGGSDSSSRMQHHELSGSESVESSRPGTPLCDERPENIPSEPRRVPRDREGPLSLPLPRFAAQIMGKGSVSVAGIKGQKDNVLSSPPPAVTSPRISNPPTPGIPHVPPPASPPPRPPSPSSNSSDSDITPPSPSLDERIRSLDERYEKWSGSRSVSAAGSEALAKLDASASERFRFSYKLLDFDLKELQPSEIVKSVLAKPSVFDEDSKRLENVNEKYDFNLFTKTSTVVTSTVTTAPLPASPVVKVVTSTTSTPTPKPAATLSPRSSGTNLPTAKGLQYPFPSHPPVQPPTPPTSVVTPRSNHGENRLKPCVNATSVSASDTRTSATNNKVNLNRTGSNNLPLLKTSEPTNNSNNKSSCNTSDTNITDTNTKQTKTVRDKSSEKVTRRRDSTNSSELPRSEVKSRRNSENNGRKSDSNDKESDNICDTSAYEEKRRAEEEKKKLEEEKKKLEEEKKRLEEEKKRLEHERLEQEHSEKLRIEKERLEQERLEKQRLEKERQDKLEKERLERLEKERIERLEKERLEKERLEKERLEKEQLERERLEKERLEKERLEQEHKREREEKERKEKEEKEKKEREEKERREREEQERLDRERKERKEKEDKERREREEREKREKEEKERKREEERKHKEDNHDKRNKDEQNIRHHNDNKHHKDSNNTELLRIDKGTKDKTRESNELNRKDVHESHNKASHEKHHHNNEKSKHQSHHGDSREVEKRKESAKENRENNLHDKIVNEIKEHHKIIESRHISIDFDKGKADPRSRSKDKNSSLPVSIGSKRRMSLQDPLDLPDESKKIKLNHEHRKLSERRDSKDSIRTEEKIKTKHKNNIAKIIEDKIRNEKLNSVKEVTMEDKRKEEKHKNKQKVEKQRSKEKTKEKEVVVMRTPSIIIEKEFLAKLDLQATEDVEKARQRKEKLEETKKSEDRKKEKRSSSERRSREEISSPSSKKEESKPLKKERSRKITHSSDAATDSDEPKKQTRSIFDIVDDEPAYISMYDKVKARSCKNMQKQEEEKRQEQIKAKFNQLKQSRAKREEKKRSTSWDEDSDSEQDRRSSKMDSNKSRKGSKMLIMSSDDEETDCHNRHRKKKEIYSDSDGEKSQQNHESSDEENHKRNSRVKHSDNFIDDDFKRMQDKIKTEIFSDSSELDQRFIDLEEKVHKKIKDEEKHAIKKEKKLKRHHLSADEIKTQIFGDSPLPEIKIEDSFDNGQLFGDASSGDDNHDTKKEIRKKHKKKNKRQKYSITSEEDTKLELTVELIKDENIDRMKSVEKKKQHGKKDRKRDKNKEEHKEKSKKSKRAKSEGKSESRRDGKMENIFGSFSEESDNEKEHKTYIDQILEEKPQTYVSDSDSVSHIEKEIHRTEEKERKEKRKERKRLEKEKRLREEENENSMDYADLGKQLEDNIKDDSNDIIETIKSEGEEQNDEVVHFSEGDDSQENKEVERKEKKKKRKKSKEEKHKHHHHHHDKSKLSKSPEQIRKEFEFLPSDQLEKPLLQSVSLPNLLDLPSPPSSKPDISTNKKRDIFIPEFGVEVDETAVKSISEDFEPTKPILETATEIKQEEVKLEKPEINEDKPRVIISQEETEDAVAALLGESFSNNSYPSCYSDDPQTSIISSDHANVSEETVPEDLEEMRQAVQNLNSGEMELKPDTPQSEHELQIDTDTEEMEDVGLRFDQSPRTPDTVDLSQPPKTPDIPSYFGPEEQPVPAPPLPPSQTSPPSLPPHQPTKTIVIKATITSPPSLTPLKSSMPLISEVKKVDISETTTVVSPPSSESLPRSYSIPIKITEQVKKDLPESVTVKPYTLTLHMQQQQQKISFNRLPITPIMMSKPFHQTTVSLPQPKVAQSTEAGAPTTKEQTHTQSRVIFQGLPSHVPQFLLNSQNSQTRMIVQNMQLPRAIIRPSGTFTGLPSKPFINQMPSSEPPKLVPTSHPLPVVSEPMPVTVAEAPKLVSLSSTVVQPSIIQSTIVKPTLVITTTVPQAEKDGTQYEKPLPSPVPMVVREVVNPVIQEEQNQAALSESEASSTPPTQDLSNAPAVIPQLTLSSVPVTHCETTSSPSNVVLPVSPQAILPQTPSKPQLEVSPLPQVQSVSPQGTTLQTPPEVIPPLEPIRAPSPEQKLPIEQVTDELSLSLKKVEESTSAEPSGVDNTKSESAVLDLPVDNEELISIRSSEKTEEDKGETESIESDISKERLSADLLTKDYGLDSKEDSDYWSAKEVNIDSVIKKVEALCSADELSDRSSEISKDDWFEVKTDVPQDIKIDEPITNVCESLDQGITRGGRRAGRSRGRRMRGSILTRRAKANKEVDNNLNQNSLTKRGGRIARTKIESTIKSDIGTSDIYEFRDESDENKDRPRLILTIKSPVLPNNGSIPTSMVKEIPKEAIASPPKVETKEDFVSPTNTRKSRRLQERGGEPGKSSVDDTIEDVIRNNNVMMTRSAAAAQATPTRRSTRQTPVKSVPENSPRKSPRSIRKKDRRTSDTTDDSSEEKSVKNVDVVSEPLELCKPPITSDEGRKEESTADSGIDVPKEKPHEGLKAAVLRRVKGDMSIQEPMTLIDPVTGVLIPMRECEEGRYIPVGLVSALANQSQIPKIVSTSSNSVSISEASVKSAELPAQTVSTTSASVIQHQIPSQSLKAQVLSPPANRVIVAPSQSQPEPVSKVVTLTVTPPVSSQSSMVIKANVPITQHLNVNVPTSNIPPAHISPRPYIPPVSKQPVQILPPVIKLAQPPVSAQIIAHIGQAKQQQVNKPILGKPHLSVPVSTNIINTQLAHMKQQVAMAQVQVIKPHTLHSQQQVLTAAVASPPLKQAHHPSQQSITGASSTRLTQISATVPNASAKSSMEPPPKVDVSMAGCVMVPHPTSSPQGAQGQARLPIQTSLPMPSYEANMGDTLTHFPPSSVKLRPSHDLIAAHYIPPHMYQQYLRQTYHLPRSPLVVSNLEKVDGQEGEEAPVELRRPGSVGLALTGRSPVVPHSLQSPHDRTTDSPQVGQVYMHNSRLPHYHPNRYFDQAEPPPAHRPLTSHTTLATLGNDRSIGHIATLGTPDRPLSSHLPPDRPLSTHLPPDRPLSSHLPPDRPLSSHLPPDRPLSTHLPPDRPLSTHLPPDRPLSTQVPSERPLSSHITPDRPLSTHSALASSHINSAGATHLAPDRPLSGHGFQLGTGLGATGNLMGAVARHIGETPASQRGLQAATPPHASQVPPQAESLVMLLKQFPCMWQGLLALKNDQAAVQMYFVSGNEEVAKCSLPKNIDGSTPPLRIFQRMRLEPPQVEGVARKMQMENEHCMLLALPCGHDHMDVLKQSTNLTNGFITYLQQKQAAGIVNVAAPGTTQPAAYVVHIFPSCDFVNENLRRFAPNLLERVSDIAHLLIVITTV